MTRHGRVQARASARQRRRAVAVETILSESESRFADHKFPTTTEELAATYAAGPADLPNETESLGDVFDRLREEYDAPRDALEAVYDDLERGETAEFDPDDVGTTYPE